MRAKVVKDRKGNLYLLLPKGLSLEGEVEIFPLKEGYFLITPPLPERPTTTAEELPPKAEAPSEEKAGDRHHLSKEEVALLHKVSLIPYARREMNFVLSQLSPEERELLHRLLERGVVLLRSRKGRQYIAFEEGLYDKLKALSKRKADEREQVEVVDLSQGFLIVKSPKTFYKLRSYLEENRAKLRYLVDPATGYVYIATKPFLARGAKALMKHLSAGEASAFELAERLRMPVEAVETIAKFLNEEGLLYEKDPKKKVYGLVE